ncbi:MAG: O-antigen ligase family protein [bacterium]|nr:O-antigen ligase family protein [bacterium]
MTGLSVLGIFIFFILGYNYPRKMGWMMMFLIPLLATNSPFCLIPSERLPLTMHRIAFAVSIGMLFQHRRGWSFLSGLMSNTVYKMILLFMIVYGLSALREEFTNTLFTYIPNLIYPILITGILIQGKDDLLKLIKILVFQTAIISGFVIIEYFFQFNISSLLKSTLPDVDTSNFWEGATIHIRSGYLRAGGIDGHPVYTGYRLAFLFPLVLWYATKKRLLGTAFLVIFVISMLLLQARAAIIVSIISFGLINAVSIKSLIKYLGLAAFSIIILAQIPFIKSFSSNFYNKSLSLVSEGLNDKSMEERVYRIPDAYDAFLKSPIIGYGSKKTVLYQVMLASSNDLPAPVMYLVAGGILAGISYVMIFLGMIWSVNRMRKRISKADEFSILFKHIMIALMAGFMVLCFNTAEAHINVMLILFTAVYKSRVLIPRIQEQRAMTLNQ